MGRVLLLLMMLCCSQPAFAEDQGGIVYGHNHAISVEAPPGWVLDNKSGVVNGVHAAVYPEGGSWVNSPAVMYANCTDKSDKSGTTLSDFIHADAESFRKHNPGIVVQKLSDEFHAGKTSEAMYFDNSVNKEAVVYVDEEKVVCMLVLSSKTEKDYTAALPAYKTFLKSYQFLTKNVELPAGQPEPAGKGVIE